MAVKLTLFMVLDKYSWTEDHFDLSASSGNLAGEAPRAQQLATLRASLLGYDASLERVRISSVPANQQVFDVLFPGNIQANWVGGQVATPGYSASRGYQALLMRLQNAGGNHRNYYMAGAPYGIFRSRPGDDSGLDFSQVPEFLLRITGYAAFLTGGGWGWLSRANLPLTQASGPLQSSAAAPGMVGIPVSAQLAGVSVGTQVLVRGWRRTNIRTCPPLSGLYKIGFIAAPVAPSTTWTYFLFNTSFITPSNFFTLGQIGPFTFTSAAYTVATPVVATQRKRGATALRPKGRARVQF